MKPRPSGRLARAQARALGAVGVIEPAFRGCEKPVSRGYGLAVSCRKCGPCLARIQLDAEGRSIAEFYGCDAVFFVTLTIGGDDRVGGVAGNGNAAALNAELVRQFEWRLSAAIRRQAGRPVSVRFLMTGEYGPERDRPHYHGVIYLRGWSELPGLAESVMTRKRFFWGRPGVETHGYPVFGDGLVIWPHGFVSVRPAVPADAMYVCKYVTKDLDELAREYTGRKRRMQPMVPRRPFMGQRFFEALIGRHVEAGLPLRFDAYQVTSLPGLERWRKEYLVPRRHQWSLYALYRDLWAKAHAANPARCPALPPRSLEIELVELRADGRRATVAFESLELHRRLRDLRANNAVRRGRRRMPEGNAYREWTRGDASLGGNDFEDLEAFWSQGRKNRRD